MIVKQTKGKSLHAVLEYALAEAHAPRMIGGNVMGASLAELSQEFLASLQIKPDITAPVLHAAFSFEAGEAISNQQMREIGDAFLERMGWDLSLSQKVYIRHYDHENTGGHPHFHAIVSRIQLDGKLVSDSWDHYRGRDICRDLELEFNLHSADAPKKLFRAPTRWEAMVYEHSGVASVKMELQRRVFEAVQTVAMASNQMGDLIEQINASGIGVLPWLNPQTQDFDGISYRLGDFVMRGQALGAAFTWAGLQHYLGIEYDPQRDTRILRQAEQAELVAAQERLKRQWGASEIKFPAERFRKRCDSFERKSVETGIAQEKSEQRFAFIRRNFEFLARALRVNLRRKPAELTEARDSGKDGELNRVNPFTITNPESFRFDLVDLRRARAEAQTLGENNRDPERDSSNDTRTDRADRDNDAGTIDRATLELRERLAALLRAGTSVPHRADRVDPAQPTGIATRIDAAVKRIAGESVTGSVERTDLSSAASASGNHPRTPAERTGTEGAEHLSLRERIAQRIDLPVESTDRSGRSNKPPNHGNLQPASQRDATAAERGNRETEGEPDEPRSLAERIRQNVRDFREQRNRQDSATGEPTGSSNRGGQPPAANRTDARSNQRRSSRNGSRANNERDSKSDERTNLPEALSEGGRATFDESGHRRRSEPAATADWLANRSPNAINRIAQTPAKQPPAMAGSHSSVDENLRRATDASSTDQLEPPVASVGDDTNGETGERDGQTAQSNQSIPSRSRGEHEKRKPTKAKAAEREQQRDQLEPHPNRDRIDGHDRDRRAFHVWQPDPKTESNNPDSNSTPNDLDALIRHYRDEYVRYCPNSQDSVQDDFAIASLTLKQGRDPTEVACILTSSPIVQQSRSRSGSAAYIEQIISDVRKMLDQQSKPQSDVVIE